MEPSPKTSMTNSTRTSSAGAPAVFIPWSKASTSESVPHTNDATLSHSPNPEVPAESISSASTSKSFEAMHIRSFCRSLKESATGVAVTRTSHPSESSVSMSCENASALPSPRKGTSSKTAREPLPPRNESVDATTPSSRSRRKHGLWQLIQNVFAKFETTFAYSSASMVFP